METKIYVAALYVDARDKCGGSRPSINSITEESGVSWPFVKKVETELLATGEVALSEDIYCKRPYISERSGPLPILSVAHFAHKSHLTWPHRSTAFPVVFFPKKILQIYML